MVFRSARVLAFAEPAIAERAAGLGVDAHDLHDSQIRTRVEGEQRAEVERDDGGRFVAGSPRPRLARRHAHDCPMCSLASPGVIAGSRVIADTLCRLERCGYTADIGHIAPSAKPRQSVAAGASRQSHHRKGNSHRLRISNRACAKDCSIAALLSVSRNSLHSDHPR